QPGDWPTIPEVQKYVSRVRQTLDDRLATVSPSDHAGDGFSASTLLNTAIEHRLMHAETLAYMLHQLPLDRKRRTPQVPVSSSSAVKTEMLPVPAGPVTLGLSHDARDRFGWDNEYEAHEVSVPSFSIARHKVTNAEFLK